jgi:hypothetical protein
VAIAVIFVVAPTVAVSATATIDAVMVAALLLS